MAGGVAGPQADAASKTITSFLSDSGQNIKVMESMLKNTEKVVEQYAVGDRVAHDEHGLGSVVSTDPHGVSVDFGNGPVRIASPFARMEKL